MYVSTSDPLPPNSRQPYPAALVARSRAKGYGIERAALRAAYAVECPIPPGQFANLGLNLVADVNRTYASLNLAGPDLTPAALMRSTTPTTDTTDAPEVIPLNPLPVPPPPGAPRGTSATKPFGTPWGDSPVTLPGRSGCTIPGVKPGFAPASLCSSPCEFLLLAAVVGLGLIELLSKGVR
jgi:hypothetical protein